MTTDSDSECSFVANLTNFNVIGVTIIVIAIKIIVITVIITFNVTLLNRIYKYLKLNRAHNIINMFIFLIRSLDFIVNK